MFLDAENAPRKPGFAEGVQVRLADGRAWTLPRLRTAREDPAQNALLNAVYEAEDQAEGRRAELALTIFLLERNYEFRPGQLLGLLSFPPNDPALADLRERVHALVLASPRPEVITEFHPGPRRLNRGLGGLARLSARFYSTWAHGVH